jgi:enterochelin esterase-like enzyme
MDFLNKLFPKKNALHAEISMLPAQGWELHCYANFPSAALERPVRVDVLLPPNHFSGSAKPYPTLWLNDGQDLPAVGLGPTLQRLVEQGKIPPIIAIGIHAGMERMEEYGTAGRPDYLKRGSKAHLYNRFLLKELLPALARRYRIARDPQQAAIAGFSLGGLAAFDLAWQHPERFGRVGVFSGSLWWRSRAFDPADPDGHRIIHHTVSQGSRRDGLRFWFQAGTEDEEEDRNNNGIIDAIDDTLDLIAELKRHGYREGREIRYVEVLGGQHNPETWGKVMPDFLRWAFG